MRCADVHARRGDFARTERELVTAAEEIERWRAQLSDAELLSLAFQATATENAAATEPTAVAAGTARALAVLAGGRRAEAAFSLAERRRAQELTDRLTRITALRTVEPERSLQSRPAAPRIAADVIAAIPDDRTALVEYVVARARRGRPQRVSTADVDGPVPNAYRSTATPQMPSLTGRARSPTATASFASRPRRTSAPGA